MPGFLRDLRPERVQNEAPAERGPDQFEYGH
jgi:hypothetical protein